MATMAAIPLEIAGPDKEENASTEMDVWTGMGGSAAGRATVIFGRCAEEEEEVTRTRDSVETGKVESVLTEMDVWTEMEDSAAGKETPTSGLCALVVLTRRRGTAEIDRAGHVMEETDALIEMGGDAELRKVV